MSRTNTPGCCSSGGGYLHVAAPGGILDGSIDLTFKEAIKQSITYQSGNIEVQNNSSQVSTPLNVFARGAAYG